MTKWPVKNFWCTINRDLPTVVETLSQTLGFTSLHSDIENVWEWSEARDSEGRVWNISHRWSGRTSGEVPWFRIVVDPPPEDPRPLAATIAKLIGAPVSFGTVTYLGGDEFSLNEEVMEHPD